MIKKQHQGIDLCNLIKNLFITNYINKSLLLKEIEKGFIRK